jgi:4-hydroxythreonine-4-phosphate dehydrogenase
MAETPLLFTMGDAAGIGPECIAKLFAAGEAQDAVVVGDAGVMRRALALTGASLHVQVLGEADLASDGSLKRLHAGTLPVWQPSALPPGLENVAWGRVDARCGAAAAVCIEMAVRLVQRGLARGIITAPLHKEALAAAGVDYPGHTEMLQALAAQSAQGSQGTQGAGEALPPVRMMLANDELRVILVTIHQSLRSAIDAVTFDAVLQTLRIAQAALPRWGVGAPRIAVAGLNPHAGEGGLFGDEELRIIGPAVQAAQAEGIDARGPYAPDTIFMRARHSPGHPGEFDAVVAMTHDHGLIPVKYLGVEQGVNITLGLPFVRTSPDHGTAFDIAGRGVADPSSLRAALHAARRAGFSPS